MGNRWRFKYYYYLWRRLPRASKRRLLRWVVRQAHESAKRRKYWKDLADRLVRDGRDLILRNYLGVENGVIDTPKKFLEMKDECDRVRLSLLKE